MIIICPNCKSGFRVTDDLISIEPKIIRCSKCGYSWKQSLNGTEEIKEDEIININSSEQKEIPQSDSSVEFNKNIETDLLSEEHFELNLSDEIERLLNILEEREKIIKNGVDIEEAATIQKEKAKEKAEEAIIKAKEEEEKEKRQSDIEDLKKEVLLEEQENDFSNKEILTSRFLRINFKLIIFILSLLLILILWFGRLSISKKYPLAQAFYDYLGIETKVLGEGLEIKNVQLNLIKDKEGTFSLEVKGMIVNNADKGIKIPLLSVELINQKGQTLYIQNEDIQTQALLAKDAGELFTVKIKNPHIEAEKAIVTFAKKKDLPPILKDIKYFISIENLKNLKTYFINFIKEIISFIKSFI